MKIKGSVCGLPQHTPNIYPVIKISESGRVVLFTAPKTGFYLTGPGGYEVGEQSSGWAEEDQFKVLCGSITLSNEGC